MSDHNHTFEYQEPANQPPKDDQIDDIANKFAGRLLGKWEPLPGEEGMLYPTRLFNEFKAELATAIREAIPDKLTEFHGQGTMQLEAKVHQAAIDQFLANLKDIGLEV